ncbi:hypothetical protein [Bradyrhizobium ottawaense]|uniref:hypothetical protein n=1 Tax=Bradyrhizobium ottawaense TaxID=931866 RepID=UPI00384E3546
MILSDLGGGGCVMKIGYFTADEEAEAWINATLKRAERAYKTKLEAASKFAEDNEWIAARVGERQAAQLYRVAPMAGGAA